MAIETVSSESGEIVDLAEAKEHLGVWDDDQDSKVNLMLTAARDYCERWGEITLRQSATRTHATRDWPSCGWVLRRPPVTAVSSITYYDADNASQTLASSNYRVSITAEGFAHIEYAASATLPTLYDRQDAVTVNYTTGWGVDSSAWPPSGKAAILLTLTYLYGEDDTRQLDSAEKAAKSLLAGIAAPTYA